MGDALVGVDGIRQYGRLATRPTTVNPLDEWSGATRRRKWLRLKEWVGFTLIHPELASSMIMQDAHYLASSELYVAELRSGLLTQHARNGRGGSVGLPASLFGSRCTFRKPGYALEYTFGDDGASHRIDMDVAGADDAASITAALELDGAHASAPLSVSIRLRGGAMYTHKVLFPVSGTLRVGDRRYEFDSSRDLAVIDEHHSVFPYHTTWIWGTFAQITADGPLGANFCRRAQEPGEPEESCIWTPAAVEALSDLVFRSDTFHEDTGGSWQVASLDGRLDVTFTPDGRKDVKHQLGLVAIDYVQLYGSYRGVLRSKHGLHELDGVRGVWERMDTRF